MSGEIKVRSRFRREVDNDALALAAVMLARILDEESAGGVPATADAQPAGLGTTKAQMPTRAGELQLRYYQDVEAMKREGWSNADAIREVARRLGRTETAVRQGIYVYLRRVDGGAA